MVNNVSPFMLTNSKIDIKGLDLGNNVIFPLQHSMDSSYMYTTRPRNRKHSHRPRFVTISQYQMCASRHPLPFPMSFFIHDTLEWVHGTFYLFPNFWLSYSSPGMLKSTILGTGYLKWCFVFRLFQMWTFSYSVSELKLFIKDILCERLYIYYLLRNINKSGVNYSSRSELRSVSVYNMYV